MIPQRSLARTVRRTALDVGIGLAIFTLLAFAISFDKSAVNPPAFSDLLSISANAAELTTATDKTDALAEAAYIVKAAVPVPPTASDGVFRNTTGATAMTLMAAIFSLLFAFNVAFFRHLRSQYAAKARFRHGIH